MKGGKYAKTLAKIQARGVFPIRDSLRSMAVLSSRAHPAKSRTAKFAREAIPISSRFLCPRRPLLLSAPNQNRHATHAIYEISEEMFYPNL